MINTVAVAFARLRWIKCKYSLKIFKSDVDGPLMTLISMFCVVFGFVISYFAHRKPKLSRRRCLGSAGKQDYISHHCLGFHGG